MPCTCHAHGMHAGRQGHLQVCTFLLLRRTVVPPCWLHLTDARKSISGRKINSRLLYLLPALPCRRSRWLASRWGTCGWPSATLHW